MLNSKAYQIFSLLTEKEKHEILDLLQSPYFNKDGNILSLFRYFINHPKPEKKNWFYTIFLNEKYEDIKVRRYLSTLNQLLEQYLVLKQLEQKEITRKELVLAALRKRMLPKHYNTQIKKPIKRTKSALDFTSDLFLHQYQLSCEKDKFDTQLNQRKPKDNTEEGILQLDLFYIVEKLRNICEVHNSRTIFEIEGQTYLNDEVLNLAQKEPFNSYPQVRIYTCLLKTITQTENEDYFYELQSLIEEHSNLLSVYEEREIYLALINYCIRKINQGNQKSLEECFKLYKKMTEKNLLISGKHLSPWTYKNIVTASLRLSELEWTFNFIKNYKNQLAEEHKENAFNYNLAKYNFQLSKYNRVLELLQKVEYDDVFYGLDARILLMKVYYLQGEDEALFSLTDSFRIYLRRKKKIPSERRKTYLNFIKFTRRLISLSPRDLKNLKALELKIQSTPKVADKAWILERVKSKMSRMKFLNEKSD